MPNYATPGVYLERAETRGAALYPVRTDIAAFVGIAAQGPLDEPTKVETWEQFQAKFGSFLPNAYLAYAARAFFANGGQKLFVVRVAAPEVLTVSSGPQPSRAFSTVSSVQGFAAGAVATASQQVSTSASGVQPVDRRSSRVASAAAFAAGARVIIRQIAPALQMVRVVKNVQPVLNLIEWDSALDAALNLANPIQFTVTLQQELLVQKVDASLNQLTWSFPLDSGFDLAQLIDFATGASAASGNYADGQGEPSLQIQARTPGVWGNRLAVRLSYSSQAATATNGTQPAGGEASYVGSVAGFPPWTLVRVYQRVSPGPAVIAYRTVNNTDAPARMIEWNAPLAPAFDITKPISFESVELNLAVYNGPSLKETFAGLSLWPKHRRYVEKAVDSALVTIKDAQPGIAPHLRLPQGHALFLRGGRDGIAALRGIDLTGDPSSSVRRGLRTLELVSEAGIIAIPDLCIEPLLAVLRDIPPAPPADPCCVPPVTPALGPPVSVIVAEAAPVFTPAVIASTQESLLQHCETQRFPFAILDQPDLNAASVPAALEDVQGWRRQFDSAFGALYTPWILVRDPIPAAGAILRRVPPSGHVAGMFAATDLSIGVHKAPANSPMLWAQAFTEVINDRQQGILNPIGINCLRTFPGRGLRIYGARTLSSATAWKYVSVRRLMSMIERSLERGLQWVVFEPNNVLLRRTVQAAVTGFLNDMWSRGALAGRNAEEAFYVTCDEGNNTLAMMQNGQFLVEIGVAPTIPAEFIVFQIGQTNDALEVAEL